jgi:hypothetical protein
MPKKGWMEKWGASFIDKVMCQSFGRPDLTLKFSIKVFTSHQMGTLSGFNFRSI